MPTRWLQPAARGARWLIAMTIVVCCAQPVQAVILSSESFAYSPAGSDLLGKAGGVGWNGPWVAGGFNASINTNYDIASGSLTYPNLQVSGERVSTAAQNAISGVQ